MQGKEYPRGKHFRINTIRKNYKKNDLSLFLSVIYKKCDLKLTLPSNKRRTENAKILINAAVFNRLNMVFIDRWWLPTQQDASKLRAAHSSFWRTDQKWSVFPQCLHVHSDLKRRPATHCPCVHPIPAPKHPPGAPFWSWTYGYWRVCARRRCTGGNRHS